MSQVEHYEVKYWHCVDRGVPEHTIDERYYTDPNGHVIFEYQHDLLKKGAVQLSTILETLQMDGWKLVSQSEETTTKPMYPSNEKNYQFERETQIRPYRYCVITERVGAKGNVKPILSMKYVTPDADEQRIRSDKYLQELVTELEHDGWQRRINYPKAIVLEYPFVVEK